MHLVSEREQNANVAATDHYLYLRTDPLLLDINRMARNSNGNAEM
jgi:hypothetical protein